MKTLTLIALSLFLIACGNTENVTTNTEAEKEFTKTEYDSIIEGYLKDKDWKTERTETGLYVYVENEGGKEKPTSTDFLTLNYTGILLDGTIFDETSGKAASFPFPISELIPGWQEGLPFFGKGGKGKLIIPPNLAFGERESGPIPSNSVIVIDLEVIDFSSTPPAPVFPEAKADYSTEIEDYMSKNNIKNAIKTPEGMYVVIEKEGTKEKPTLSNSVTIFYKGYLLDNTVFDQTENETRTFPLNGLVAGWQIGIPYIGKGGKCKLIIPPHLGYGSVASGPIPANSVLVFDIELEDFK